MESDPWLELFVDIKPLEHPVAISRSDWDNIDAMPTIIDDKIVSESPTHEVVAPPRSGFNFVSVGTIPRAAPSETNKIFTLDGKISSKVNKLTSIPDVTAPPLFRKHRNINVVPLGTIKRAPESKKTIRVVLGHVPEKKVNISFCKWTPKN
jgi:hypothetical protein